MKTIKNLETAGRVGLGFGFGHFFKTYVVIFEIFVVYFVFFKFHILYFFNIFFEIFFHKFFKY